MCPNVQPRGQKDVLCGLCCQKHLPLIYCWLVLQPTAITKHPSEGPFYYIAANTTLYAMKLLHLETGALRNHQQQ